MSIFLFSIFLNESGDGVEAKKYFPHSDVDSRKPVSYWRHDTQHEAHRPVSAA